MPSAEILSIQISITYLISKLTLRLIQQTAKTPVFGNDLIEAVETKLSVNIAEMRETPHLKMKGELGDRHGRSERP